MIIYRFVAILLTAMMFAFNCEGQFDEGLGDDNQQEVPADPENPDTPGDPETPGEPEDPDTPSEPDTPQEPDKPDTPAEPENPAEPEGPVYYVKVNQDYSDWSGDYLITYTESSSIKVFDSWDPYGQSKTDLGSSLTTNGIPAEVADKYKAVVSKVGEYYSIYVTNVGYIGYTSTNNSLALSESAPAAGSKYLWDFSYMEGKDLWLQISHNTGRRLQWNSSAPRFACYNGSQNEITLYRRTVSTGTLPPGQPDTPTEPEQPTEPDTPVEPDQPSQPDQPTEPDTPSTPTTGSSGKYGWYELPVINYYQSESYLIDNNNKNLYYAHHMCAGNEKGPGGKKARNYTVCYSAEHHCPVWVAAPRHAMYQTKGTERTDAYGKDPSIPSNIQYSSKSTGGGCNKGHMLGSAERISSNATNKQVFYYTNIAPQYSGTFNTGGGGWNILEEFVDGKVCSDTLYVVIGAYFENYTDKYGNTGKPATISFGGRNDVTRPSMFYYLLMRTKKGNTGKALSECTKDEIMCAAFVRCHEIAKGTKVSAKDMMSVSDMEKLTGFTYFPNVPQAPKDTYKASDWGL